MIIALPTKLHKALSDLAKSRTRLGEYVRCNNDPNNEPHAKYIKFRLSAFPSLHRYRFINIIWFVCDWLAMSNSCYNPFIYGIYNVSIQPKSTPRGKCK